MLSDGFAGWLFGSSPEHACDSIQTIAENTPTVAGDLLHHVSNEFGMAGICCESEFKKEPPEMISLSSSSSTEGSFSSSTEGTADTFPRVVSWSRNGQEMQDTDSNSQVKKSTEIPNEKPDE